MSEPAEVLSKAGFLVEQSVFSRAEIQALRNRVLSDLKSYGHFAGGGVALPDAAVDGTVVPDILTDNRIVDRFRQLLQVDRPAFTMEADLHCNFLASAWHKDTGEQVMENGYFDCDPIPRKDCRVVKCAIYLQDHLEGGGLNVRQGSHRYRDLTSGTELTLKLREGDVVFFDVRLTHRGTLPAMSDRALGTLAKAISTGDSARRIAQARSAYNRALHRPDRLAIYLAFGAPGPMTDTFARRNMSRQRAQRSRGAWTVKPELAERASAAGIELVDTATV